ncbi:PGG domain [Macleaya cordata]|uniref:PGG domain n=1 Tax=Macleaya cordata TaxID=56857 RepID=A0A200R811_MACCD|nr:PGG domain [Macleaya cordata]
MIKEEIDESLILRLESIDDHSGKSERKTLEKASQTHLLVATLIATVIFVACFQIPGGYVQRRQEHQGMAVLTKASDFKVFLIFNSIALLFSASAVTVHFFSKTIVRVEDEVSSSRLLKITFHCTLYAIIAMVLAFQFGISAVVDPSIGLVINILSCSYSLVYYYALWRVGKRMKKDF